MELAISPIQREDINALVRYWTEASPEFLKGMGVDLSKMLSENQLKSMLEQQLKTEISQKTSYATIWLIDQKAVGHCNLGEIKFGESAMMHLHMWQSGNRKKGVGTELVKLSVRHFFEVMQLEKIYCEPMAKNIAPNKTLENVGFTFLEKVFKVPGYINYVQYVNRWEINREVGLSL